MLVIVNKLKTVIFISFLRNDRSNFKMFAGQRTASQKVICPQGTQELQFFQFLKFQLKLTFMSLLWIQML
jgi:hypothetical protein